MIAFSIAAVLILLLGACGAPAPGSTPATGNDVKGGTWTDDLFEEPNSLIPNGSSETSAVMVD